jgi:hypothetical protein
MDSLDIALPFGRGMRSASKRDGLAASASAAHRHHDVPCVRDLATAVSLPVGSANHAFLEYFRCPMSVPAFGPPKDQRSRQGYFTFHGTICYGRSADGLPAVKVSDALPEISHAARAEGERICLPFDLSEVLVNLRQERYPQTTDNFLGKLASSQAARALYYLVRPILGVSVRKHLQKMRLSDRDRIVFPQWPVDFSVENLMQSAMVLTLKNRRIEKIPFIWFWPDGANACAILTHDVESQAGQRFCSTLMDLDESFGMRSSFQVMPEPRDDHFSEFVETIRRRGFELNLHDLNHDGHLFRNRDEFLRRAAQINEYARELGCRGFRSGAMYREQDWFDAFEFSYDMSVPNAAHLEPQRGGCCTVMPYFVGNVLELPLTTTQDYSLFHILGDYSTTLWERQIDAIVSEHGLISFIAHPDYLVGRRERAVYEGLLRHLSRVRDEQHVWMALPGEVNDWWCNRRLMTLVPDGESWRIDGPGRERARLAYATMDGDRLVYKLAEES